MGYVNPYLNNMTYSDIMGADNLYYLRGNALDIRGGCSLDGLPIPCSLANEAIASETNSAAFEYRLNDGTVVAEQGKIQNLGAGLFIFDHPTVELDNEPGDSAYRLGWRTGSFYLLRQEKTPKDNRTDCEHMADDAQRIAGETRADFPKANAAWTLQEFNKRYGQVTFGSYFAETPLGFLGTPASGRKTVLGNRSYKGDSGFPEKFRDTLQPGQDQVHHFGAYFSAGLAGHKLIPKWHRDDDREAGNTGDVELAKQSERLGDYLRRNPSQLSNVGKLIKDAICGAGAVPR